MSSSSTGKGAWFDAEAASFQILLDEYGEAFTLQPYQVMQVNFPTGPDPTRSPYDFIGIFERDAKDVSKGLEDVHISTGHLCVTAMVADVPNVRQGDRLLYKQTGEMFELTDVRPDGLSGVELRMVQLGRAKQ